VESEPTLAEARASWPVEADAVAIEAASLPALAGDAPTDARKIIPIREGGPERAAPADSADEDAPKARLPSEEPEVEEARPAEPIPTAEPEQGVPYAGQTEREPEPAAAGSSPPHEPEPAHPVETVTEKPANPRRGWWQRLIQS
jgi:hypothetical protein